MLDVEKILDPTSALNEMSRADQEAYCELIGFLCGKFGSNDSAKDYQLWIGPANNGDPRDHVYFAIALLLQKNVPQLLEDVRNFEASRDVVYQVAFFDLKNGYHSFVCSTNIKGMMRPVQFATEDALQEWLMMSHEITAAAEEQGDAHISMFVSEYEEKYGALPTAYELLQSSKKCGKLFHWLPRSSQVPTFTVTGNYGDLTIETLTGKVLSYDSADPDIPEYRNINKISIEEYVSYWGVYPVGGQVYDINDFAFEEYEGESFTRPNLPWREERKAMLKTQKELDPSWDVGYPEPYND